MFFFFFVRQSNNFEWPADPHKYSLTNFESIESAGPYLAPVTHTPVYRAEIRDHSDKDAFCWHCGGLYMALGFVRDPILVHVY